MDEPKPVTRDRLLRACGLTVGYGFGPVLHGVDFELAAGEAVALVGRNGMGKSTLLKGLIGILAPSAGTLHVGGADVLGWNTSRIARLGMGYVPEGRGVFPNLSVRENLVMSARAGRDGRREWTLSRVLDLFPQLSARLHHAGDALSGGEQQMVALGRALLTNPSILLVDEATEGLAPRVAGQLWSALKNARGSGLAMVVVDKDFDALRACADRFVIMEKGRVAWCGRSDLLDENREVFEQFVGVA